MEAPILKEEQDEEDDEDEDDAESEHEAVENCAFIIEIPGETESQNKNNRKISDHLWGTFSNFQKKSRSCLSNFRR